MELTVWAGARPASDRHSPRGTACGTRMGRIGSGMRPIPGFIATRQGVAITIAA